MSQMQEISEIEQAYHELEKIKRQMDALSDFLASKLRDRHTSAPKTRGMIDPRTNRPFRKKIIRRV
jgi:hypothetical protein